MLKQVFQERIGRLLKDYVQGDVSDSDVSLSNILKGDVRAVPSRMPHLHPRLCESHSHPHPNRAPRPRR